MPRQSRPKRRWRDIYWNEDRQVILIGQHRNKPARNIVIDNIELSGCRVLDKNGAGIRQEGSNLTIRNCYFHDNENGILSGKNPASEILIEKAEFANGFELSQ